MAEFYLDHNVAAEVEVYLRLAGHGVRTTRALGKQRAGDDEQLAIAANNHWILVTHNIGDFQLLHNAWLRWSAMWDVPAQHPGILAMEPGPNERKLAWAIEDLLTSRAVINGQLHVWRPRLDWQHRV